MNAFRHKFLSIFLCFIAFNLFAEEVKKPQTYRKEELRELGFIVIKIQKDYDFIYVRLASLSPPSVELALRFQVYDSEIDASNSFEEMLKDYSQCPGPAPFKIGKQTRLGGGMTDYIICVQGARSIAVLSFSNSTSESNEDSINLELGKNLLKFTLDQIDNGNVDVFGPLAEIPYGLQRN